jgi:hypothetical protein
MAIPNAGGGFIRTGGLPGEAYLGVQPAPASMTSTAAITAAQLATGLILGNPGSSAATYTLPTVALWEALVTNAVNPDVSFDFSVINVDGSGSGIITMAVGTGWTLVGLATIAATAGTTHAYRARKTGAGAWTLYTLA